MKATSSSSSIFGIRRSTDTMQRAYVMRTRLDEKRDILFSRRRVDERVIFSSRRSRRRSDGRRKANMSYGRRAKNSALAGDRVRIAAEIAAATEDR